MTRRITLLFAMGIAAIVASAQSPTQPHIKVFLNEVQPGQLSASQYCTVVFADRHFHSEKADLKHGQDSSRRIYEGQLSDAEWNSLVAIVDSPAFRDMTIPHTVPPLVMQDTHPYTISVARDNDFQNMEFLDSKSLKPFESQIKPLLQWWKPIRNRHMAESTAHASPQCALDSSHAVYAQ